MNALSRYWIFCKVVEVGSFTGVAREIGYSQSAVSQIVKGIEEELGVQMIERRKDGIRLTEDGKQFYPYLQSISNAEEALRRKKKEMDGLEKGMIRILSFTSVSRNLLPGWIKSFKEMYPGVSFLIRQGDYATIRSEILGGEVDFGFISTGADHRDLQTRSLYEDSMVAVLPEGHPFAKKKILSLKDLAEEPFILLDEGEDFNTALKAFEKHGITPNVQYNIYDDYTILAMIRQNFGVSVLFRNVVTGFEDGVVIRELAENPTRTLELAWKDWNTMPLASRLFAEFILKSFENDRNGSRKTKPRSREKTGSGEMVRPGKNRP